MAYPLGQALLYGAIIALVMAVTSPLWTRALVKIANFFRRQLSDAGNELEGKNSREGDKDVPVQK